MRVYHIRTDVFVNDGEKVLTATIYTDLAAEGITFLANGAARIKVTKYSLDKVVT